MVFSCYLIHTYLDELNSFQEKKISLIILQQPDTVRITLKSFMRF